MIEASTPVRICDNGGWTDTWFGGPGRVLNIAVTPGVEVSIRATAGPDPVILEVGSSGERYPIVPGASRIARHPLLEAALDEYPPPGDVDVEINVRSEVPAGCGTGTSAAVAVAMLGGLTRLRSEKPSQRDVAYAAHRLEVEILGLESGIQDQLSAAFGGINYIEIDPYPEATVYGLPAWEELSFLLTLVYLGRAHDSPGVHRQVIEGARGGPGSDVFSRLREAAAAGRDAVILRDLEALGAAMISNTEAQQSLHPQLVGGDALRVIEIASAQRAVGWKVNGAGGDGGSVTILSANSDAKEKLESSLVALDPRYRVLPVAVSRFGLRVDGAL